MLSLTIFTYFVSGRVEIDFRGEEMEFQSGSHTLLPLPITSYCQTSRIKRDLERKEWSCQGPKGKCGVTAMGMMCDENVSKLDYVVLVVQLYKYTETTKFYIIEWG